MYSSIHPKFLNTCIDLYNYHQFTQNCSINRNYSLLLPLCTHTLFPFLCPWNHSSDLHHFLSFQGCHVNGVIQLVIFCDWLLQFTIMPLSFIQVVKFIFNCWVIFHYMNVAQFVYPFIHWRIFVSFPVLMITNRPVINICAWCLCDHTLSYL